MSPAILKAVKVERNNEDFLSAWMETYSALPTSKLFLEWAGLFTISAAAGRRVWLKGNSLFPPLYPNLYVTLVGPPGSGKDIAINAASGLMEKANKTLDNSSSFHLAGESMSGKGIIDRMASEKAQKTFRWREGDKDHLCTYYSLIVCAPEMGTILPEYDTRLISNLNELFNCKEAFQETVRGGTGHLTIENPHVALLFGTQPNTLATVFPEQTFSMGFTARIIFIYASQICKQPIISFDEFDENPHHDLTQDLRRITEITGRFSISQKTAMLINDFHLDGADKTAVNGVRFEHYNTRRSLHAQKIAMLISLSEGNSLRIEPKHWERALELLFKTEDAMPDIFTGVSSGRGFVDRLYDLTVFGDTITHAQTVAALARRCSPGEISYVIGSGLSSGFMTEVAGSSPRKYKLNVDALKVSR
jgi:hypothetical protein